MTFRLVLASFVVGSLACSSTNDTCPPIGCGEAFVVDVHTADGKPLAAKIYTLEIRMDGALTSISCKVPGASGPADCFGSGSDARVSLTFPPDSTFISVHVNNSAKTIAVKVEAAGETRGDQTFTPSYTGAAAGPQKDCPICLHADSATMTLTK